MQQSKEEVGTLHATEHRGSRNSPCNRAWRKDPFVQQNKKDEETFHHATTHGKGNYFKHDALCSRSWIVITIQPNHKQNVKLYIALFKLSLFDTLFSWSSRHCVWFCDLRSVYKSSLMVAKSFAKCCITFNNKLRRYKKRGCERKYRRK